MSTPETSRAATTPDTADYAVLRWLVAACFIVILNETIMINAMPRLMVEFDVTARSAQWLSTAFMLTMAVVIPVTGWFLQRVTTRQAFALAMVVFCTGTTIAALAPVFGVLLAGRVVQAAGTAVMMPLLMTTLMTVVPERDRGRVMGNVTLAMSVAPALGPAVSGVILQWMSWRWMFGLVLPIAAVIALVGLRRLTDVGEPTAGRVDLFSVVLSALGFGSLVYGLSLIGATDPTVSPAALIGLGLLVVAGFVVRQLRLQRDGEPLLDLRTLRHRTYTVALVAMAVAFMGMLGAMVLLPLYLQDARQLSVLTTGLMLMPGGLAMGLLGPRVGRVFDQYGARPLLVPGAIGIVVTLVVFTRIGLHTPLWLIVATHVVLMVCMAGVFTPVFTLGLGAVPPRLYSHASSLLGALQQVAGAMGTALVITVMSSRATSLVEQGEDPLSAMVGGMHWSFALGAALSLVELATVAALPNRLPSADGPAESPGSPEPDAPVDALV